MKNFFNRPVGFFEADARRLGCGYIPDDIKKKVLISCEPSSSTDLKLTLLKDRRFSFLRRLILSPEQVGPFRIFEDNWSPWFIRALSFMRFREH